MNSDSCIKMFKDSGALLDGHFVLTSGRHSSSYFQCAKLLQYPKYLELFSGSIANHFMSEQIDFVISPAVGGIVLGTEIGRILKKRTIFAFSLAKSLIDVPEPWGLIECCIPS